MATGTIHVIARFAVRPEAVDRFVQEARAALVEPARREKGCIRYDLCQDAADPTRFAMVEEWESEDALEIHLAQDSLREALARLTPMAAGPVETQRLRSTQDRG